MGGIDFDPASCSEANQTVRATTFFGREQDGLVQRWWGRVFLNPPFGMTWKRWAEKLAREIEAGRVQQAFLVGQGNVLWGIGAPWFRPLWQGSLFLPHTQPNFLDPVSGKWVGVRYGVFLYYYGPRQVRFARVFGDKGIILRPMTIHSLFRQNCPASGELGEGELCVESIK